MSALAERLIILFLILLVQIIYVKPVYAYLDPGTFSYFIQVVLAGLIGGIFAIRGSIKLVWLRVKNTFENLFKTKKKNAKIASVSENKK